MKHITKLLLLAMLIVFASCQDETLTEENSSIAEEEIALETETLVSDGQEDATFLLDGDSETMPVKALKFNLSSNLSKGSAKEVKQAYSTVNLDRCDYPNGLIANFWWPQTPTSFNSGFFASNDDYQLKFTEFTDGTASITGQTKMGTCIVDVNVILHNKKDWEAFSSPQNGGSFKDEFNDCTDADPTILDYYIIDSSKSSITSTGGDCIEEGTFGIEQRPDPEDPSTENLGTLVGKGAGLFDEANKDMSGVSTWGWITKNGERLWIMDFNFNIEPIEVPCSDCEGKVTDLDLKYNWRNSNRVRVYQKRINSCYGIKVFDKVLKPGEEFTLDTDQVGAGGRYAYIYIGHCYYTKIDISCNIKVGPGYKKGVFKVISGNSSHGGELCEYVKPHRNYCTYGWGRWW